MNYFKRDYLLKQIAKNSATFNFTNKKTNHKGSIEITKAGIKLIRRQLLKNKCKYLLLDNVHNVKPYQTLTEISKYLGLDNLEVNDLYQVHSRSYTIISKESFLLLLEGIEITSQSTSTNTNNYIPHKSSYTPSLFQSLSKQKEVKRRPFEWHDAFLEGMRIFGDVEEAEGYADDEKDKYDNKH